MKTAPEKQQRVLVTLWNGSHRLGTVLGTNEGSKTAFVRLDPKEGQSNHVTASWGWSAMEPV